MYVSWIFVQIHLWPIFFRVHLKHLWPCILVSASEVYDPIVISSVKYGHYLRSFATRVLCLISLHAQTFKSFGLTLFTVKRFWTLPKDPYNCIKECLIKASEFWIQGVLFFSFVCGHLRIASSFVRSLLV